MVGRVVGVYFWGLVADRYGRRPVVFISLWSTAAFAVAFGFSTTFFWAVVFRYEAPQHLDKLVQQHAHFYHVTHNTSLHRQSMGSSAV